MEQKYAGAKVWIEFFSKRGVIMSMPSYQTHMDGDATVVGAAAERWHEGTARSKVPMSQNWPVTLYLQGFLQVQ